MCAIHNNITLRGKPACSVTRNSSSDQLHLPQINISTDHTDATVPAKDGTRKVKCCDDPNKTYWIPLLKESVART